MDRYSRQTARHTDTQTYIQIDRHIDTQKNRHTDRIDRTTDRQPSLGNILHERLHTRNRRHTNCGIRRRSNKSMDGWMGG